VTSGAVGTAVALVAGEAVMLVLMAVSCSRFAGVHVGARQLSPLIASAAMLPPLVLLQATPLLAVPVAGCLYSVVLLATRGVSLSDFRYAGGRS
jgi:hypothetical protein